MKYIEVCVKRKFCLDEIVRDGIYFFHLMGFIEISDRTDLSSGPKEAIDVYNETVIEIEQIGKKYGLFDEQQCAENPWYELDTLWPKMNEFFRKHIIVR